MPDQNKPSIDPRIGKLIPAQEMEEAFTVPSLSANRYFIQPVSSGARIAFGEQVPGSDKIHFRVAVTLSNEDAVQLYKLLQHMLKEFEEAPAVGAGDAQVQADG